MPVSDGTRRAATLETEHPMIPKTSLTAAGLCALAPLAAAQSFDYSDFTDWTGISPVGLTTQQGAILRLQDNIAPGSGGDNRGAAWYEDAVNVAGGFDTTFVYHMHTPSTTGGSDGMAFVIQNDMVAGVPMTTGYPDGIGNKAIGRHASAAGFGVFTTSGPGESVDNSLAIHFDTYNNGTWGDTNSNHISVHTGGTGDNSQHEDFSLGRVSPSTNLNDGSPHTVRVLYVPGTLEIHLDGNLELSVPYDFSTGGTYVDSGNPVGGLDLIGGSSAYVGFTSGAGGAREYRDILSWSFDSAGGPIGSSYCGPANLNSSGMPGVISAFGSDMVGANDVRLDAAQMPTNQFGYFINSMTQGFTQPPGSQGNLCLGGAIGRHTANVMSTGAAGEFSLQLDLTVLPTPGGPYAVQAGETWYWSTWFRDANPGNTSNFTDGVQITFN